MSPSPPPPPPPPARWAVWLATGLGAGYLPKMPGTYGSLEGVGIYLALDYAARAAGLPRAGLAVLVIFLAVISVWITAKALPHFSSSDPQVIVIDEIAGQAATLLGLAFWPAGAHWGWIHILAGFILFRILDIVKPLLIRRADKLPGAWGVVADDVSAGLTGGLLLWAWGQFATTV